MPANQELPRKKVRPIKILIAPSIDGNRSKATSCKFGPYVSGGADQDARKVTTEWNAKLKYRDSPEFRRRLHQTHPSAPFLPYLFRQDGKDRAAGGNRQLQSRYNLSVSAAPSQLPWKGRLFRCGGGSIPQALRASSLYTRELLLYWKCSAKVSQWSRRWARLRLRAAVQAARVS